MNKHTRLKALHIASGDLWAGAEVQLFTLCKTLHTASLASINVILLNHGELERKLRQTGIQVTVIDEKIFNSLQILLFLVRSIRDYSPDVIHTHRTKENILGSFAALLAGNFPSIRTTHGAPEYRISWLQLTKRIIMSLDWFSGRFMQKRIIAVSDDLAEILKTIFPSHNIRIIENGIDVNNLLYQCQKQSNEQRSDINVFRIGIAGRLVSVKRVDIFIETARFMLDNYTEMKLSFHIFGDGPLFDSLVKLSCELKTDKTVIFEGHCDNMARALQNIDVLLLTSDHEGLPMILLEAMTLQTPIVAHAVGGVTNLLDHGSCGTLVINHSAPGYAEKIHHLVTNPSARAKICKNAFARVNDRYTAETNAHEYLSEYNLISKNTNS